MITIPTFTELYTDILSDLETEVGVTIPVFGRNFLRALAAVQAAKLKLFYLALGNLQKNIFIDTAEPENIGGTLERFGRVKLNRNPFPARAGQYTIQVSGTIGSVIPAQTTFKSNDDSLSPSKLFVLDAAFTTVTNPDTILVRALEGGLDSKLSVGDELTATAPISGISSLTEVTVETVEPLAAETIEEYRQTALDAYRLEPQGGAATDYRLWSQDAQGVAQVYPYAKSGFANEINLYVEANIADSTDGKGTPSGALLTEVEAVVEFDPDTTRPLNERGRRPLTVHQIHFLAITPLDVDITINGYVGLTAAIQTAIEAAIESDVNSIRPFVSAADILENKNDILDTNRIIAAILNARPGSVFGGIDLSVGGVPTSSYVFANGNIPLYNSLTFA